MQDKIYQALLQAYTAGLGEGMHRQELAMDPKGFWDRLGFPDGFEKGFTETSAVQFIENSKIMEQFKEKSNV